MTKSESYFEKVDRLQKVIKIVLDICDLSRVTWRCVRVGEVFLKLQENGLYILNIDQDPEISIRPHTFVFEIIEDRAVIAGYTNVIELSSESSPHGGYVGMDLYYEFALNYLKVMLYIYYSLN